MKGALDARPSTEIALGSMTDPKRFDSRALAEPKETCAALFGIHLGMRTGMAKTFLASNGVMPAGERPGQDSQRQRRGA